MGYMVVVALRDPVPVSTLTSWDKTLQPLMNSMLLSSSVAVTATAIGVALAILVTKTNLPASRLAQLAFPLPLVIPSFVGASAIIVATGPSGLLSMIPRPVGFWGAFVVLSLLTYPYVYLPTVARLLACPPSLEEASRTLGKGPFTTVMYVVVPQVRNTALGGGLLVFLYVLSDFGAVAMLRYDTITRTMFSARLLDRSLSITLGVILLAIALTVAALARTQAETATRSSDRPVRYDLGRWRWPALTIAMLPVFVAVVIPVGVFLTWAIRGSNDRTSPYTGLTGDWTFLAQPIFGSFAAALTAAVVTTLVTLPVAYAMVRSTNRIADVVGAVVAATFAVPGLVVALALAYWVLSAPDAMMFLYQSFPLLVLGYVVHFGAQSLRGSEAALAAVPERVGEAAATLGAGPWQRMRQVIIPLAWPGIQAGAGLVMLSTLKELPATLLLSPPGFKALATSIWAAAEEAYFAEVGATSLVLIVLSAVMSWFLILRKAPKINA